VERRAAAREPGPSSPERERRVALTRSGSVVGGTGRRLARELAAVPEA